MSCVSSLIFLLVAHIQSMINVDFDFMNLNPDVDQCVSLALSRRVS